MNIPSGERRGSGKPTISLGSLRRLLNPLVRLLTKMQVRPDTLTAAGWAFSLAAGVLFGFGYIRLGGVVMLLAGLFDALDGAVARESKSMSIFGAFLDSTLDRLSEAAIFSGIIFYYAASSRPFEVLAAAAAMSFSLLTSYARARAEGLGLECKVGLFERPERVLILALFALLGFLTAGIAVIAAGALITTTQRIAHVRRLSRS